MSTASEMLAAIRARLAAARAKVGTQSGPLVNPTKANLDADLVDTQSMIADFFNLIGDVGELDDGKLEATLSAIADACWCLSSQAVDISDAPNPDYNSIGSNLQRIDWMIDVDDGYRDLAGIT